MLAFPFDLYQRLDRDTALESRLLTLFVRELTAHLRQPSRSYHGWEGP